MHRETLSIEGGVFMSAFADYGRNMEACQSKTARATGLYKQGYIVKIGPSLL